jgi:hypothetical protein
MNKFSKIVLGLKALLGQKAPSSAVTDNFSPSEEEQAIWEEMAFGKPVTQFRCQSCQQSGNFHWCHNHECKSETCACGKGMEPGAAVCDDCLEESELVIPAVCKGCGKVDHKVVSDFCRDCEVNGTEWTLRGGNDTGTPDTSTDTNLDLDGIDDLLFECPCAGTGGICKRCLKINNAHSE